MRDATAVRAGNAYVEAAGDDSLLGKAMQSARAKLQAFGATVRDAAGQPILAAAADEFHLTGD